MLAAYSAVVCVAYGFLLNLWFWPFLTTDAGTAPGLSYVPGAPASDNLVHWLRFDLAVDPWQQRNLVPKAPTPNR